MAGPEWRSDDTADWLLRLPPFDMPVRWWWSGGGGGGRGGAGAGEGGGLGGGALCSPLGWGQAPVEGTCSP